MSAKSNSLSPKQIERLLARHAEWQQKHSDAFAAVESGSYDVVGVKTEKAAAKKRDTAFEKLTELAEQLRANGFTLQHADSTPVKAEGDEPTLTPDGTPEGTPVAKGRIASESTQPEQPAGPHIVDSDLVDDVRYSIDDEGKLWAPEGDERCGKIIGYVARFPEGGGWMIAHDGADGPISTDDGPKRFTSRRKAIVELLADLTVAA